MNPKIELLAPAGNFEKLEIAVHYGADAVYLSGKQFSLRGLSKNFTLTEMKEARAFCHRQQVKVYVACNIFSRNSEQDDIAAYLAALGSIQPDAVIIADPGVLWMAKRVIPQIPLHLSTQANTTNFNSIAFWDHWGVKRVNAARELSLKEIACLVSKSDVKIEAFVHGAMCISYSGRCLLSAFMADRDGNHGMCCHPCRWKYAVVEETRPGKYLPVLADERGSYLFHSRDLCMINHVPELIESGIASLKIEGRMKGIHYLATAVRVYREAIDAYYERPREYRVRSYWLDDLKRISQRGYCTGFYFGHPEASICKQDGSDDDSPDMPTSHIFLGKVIESTKNRAPRVAVRNKLFKGDSVEIVRPKGPARRDVIVDVFAENGQSIPHAQPGSIVNLCLQSHCQPNDLIRKGTRSTNPPYSEIGTA